MEPTRDGELEDARGERERRMEWERETEELYEQAVRLSLVHEAYLLAAGVPRSRAVPASGDEQRSGGVPVPASGKAMVSLRVPTAAEAAAQEDCPVCLDQLSQGDGRRLRMMPCSHAFHQRCIFRWLNSNSTCPCCRFKLPTDQEQRLLDEQQAAAVQAGAN